MADKQLPPIIIKRVKKGGDHGHHGGAWKVAYADFVTAMMAFFLLMWLLNATSAEQKRGIANYFEPIALDMQSSGSGDFLAGASISPDGALNGEQSDVGIEATYKFVSDIKHQSNKQADEEKTDSSSAKQNDKRDDIFQNTVSTSGDKGEGQNKANSNNSAVSQAKALSPREISKKYQEMFANKSKEELVLAKEELKKQLSENEKAAQQVLFEKVKKEIEEVVKNTPDIQDLAENLLIDNTPEGMRLQIIDKNKVAMFDRGKSDLKPRTKLLLEKISEVVAKLPNYITITGHTDSLPYADSVEYTNWELSADRANASRRTFLNHNFPYERIALVVGKADTEPLIPNDPFDAQNRRISIVLLNEPPNH